MKKVVLTAMVIMAAAYAQAAMQASAVITGEGVGMSIDGLGTSDSGWIQAEIPANATIELAYLYSAAIWTRPNTPVTFAGTTLLPAGNRLDVGVRNGNIEMEECRWDVTAAVAAGYNSAGGIFSFEVTESRDDYDYTPDGEILAVIYSVDGGDVMTAAIMDGELDPTGETFGVDLGQPYAGEDVIMSLGISYGYQSPDVLTQYTSVDINGQRLTSSAGGQDDGYAGNGGLITAGGVGDSLANPSPWSLPNGDPGMDDELYNLASFLGTGDTSFTVSTVNPSDNDNVFFLGLVTPGASTINPTPDGGATLMLLGSALGLIAALRKRIG